MKKWQVRIPAGRWMGGYVHRFGTKKRALAFIAKWNATEEKAGNAALTFHRFGPETYEACEA